MQSVRILWFGAHPDDELFVAPWLGAMFDRGAAIGFLVATRGEQGPCYRPEGCAPDLATVRAAVADPRSAVPPLADASGDDRRLCRRGG